MLCPEELDRFQLIDQSEMIHRLVIVFALIASVGAADTAFITLQYQQQINGITNCSAVSSLTAQPVGYCYNHVQYASTNSSSGTSNTYNSGCSGASNTTAFSFNSCTNSSTYVYYTTATTYSPAPGSNDLVQMIFANGGCSGQPVWTQITYNAGTAAITSSCQPTTLSGFTTISVLGNSSQVHFVSEATGSACPLAVIFMMLVFISL
ncbi:hypothetical protein PROFUN_06756 [Planoprotostelium fungivorum]|uniref:Uncharacterized protein n=1 Tax=Planoprotostelium fungivorum TaxID=1890364 RepID=A0A2P6NNJ0_9EUKA|nr:hypothetical protein PROFUN_06756 [Planoprotostelium fungivorum]